MTNMKREKVYLITTNVDSYRFNIPAEIIGIEMCTPDIQNAQSRLCYHIIFNDFVEDWVPIGETTHNYKIVTFNNAIAECIKNKIQKEWECK